MTFNDLKVSGWRPLKATTSYWYTWEGEWPEAKDIPLALTSWIMESEVTGKVKTFWEIHSSKNPLPVKGIFESSYEALRKFLVTNGFHVDGSTGIRETVYIRH